MVVNFLMCHDFILDCMQSMQEANFQNMQSVVSGIINDRLAAKDGGGSPWLPQERPQGRTDPALMANWL